MPSADDLLQPLRDRPETSVIAIDFDGTLSAIVDDPADAVPLPGAVDLLDQLAGRYGTVTVISGRPLSFLAPHFPATVEVIGLYGLEGLTAGRRWEHPNSGAWRETLGDIAAMAAKQGPSGMRIELKELSITLHYRGAPELAGPVEAYARAQAERSGLRARPARMSFELHPPIDVDKGSVITGLAEARTGLLYAGDDVGDLPAFEALGRLRNEGVHTVRIGVNSEEAPEELAGAVDLLVDEPAGLLDLLRTHL